MNKRNNTPAYTANNQNPIDIKVSGEEELLDSINHECQQADVDKINNRYNASNGGVYYLTPLSFAYKVWLFRWAPNLREYVIGGLYWHEVRNLLEDAGYYRRLIGKDYIFIQKRGSVIRETTPESMRHYIMEYVQSFHENVTFVYGKVDFSIPPGALQEIFLNNSNNLFNKTWLQHLKVHDEPVLKDTSDEMYFVFQNCLVVVTREGKSISDLHQRRGMCVWEDQIIRHDFNLIEDGTNSHFHSFLINISAMNDERLSSMSSGIGYLMHHHFNESEGQAVILYDESLGEGNAPMGGSGKGVLVNAIKQVRRVSKIDGKLLDIGNKFKWENVSPSTQVAWLDDVKPDFEFSMLHSNLTDGWTVERKFQSQFVIASKDSPKTVISSNSIIRGEGTTNKRRQFVIEVSDFYSRQIITGQEKPIEDTHGCIFFSDKSWSGDEWNKFFNVMFNCAHLYLKHKLIHFKGINVAYKQLIQSTDRDFVEWVNKEDLKINSDYETKLYFQKFTDEYGALLFEMSQRKFTENLKIFAKFKSWKLGTYQSGSKSYFRFVCI